jgi:hypothetical protein
MLPTRDLPKDLPKDLLSIEKQGSALTLTTFVACLLTGALVYLIQTHSAWLQWSIIAHVVTAIAASIGFAPYLYVHFKRTMGFRRPGTLISGVITIPVFICFVITGAFLMVTGQQENQVWILDLHIISGFAFALLVAGHLLVHFVSLPARRRDQDSGGFPSLSRPMLIQLVSFNLALQLLIGLVSATSEAEVYPFTTAFVTTPSVVDYQYDYGPHRFRPSQTETSNGAFIDQRQIANSARCLGCHADIGQQWLASAHQQAASDPTYVTNIELLAEKKGISSTRYCEGCHAPVALLSGELSPGGLHGGVPGTPANDEGISCMSCHGIESVVHLKGVASFQFSPASPYLFETSDNTILKALNGWLIRLKPDQHKRDLGREILKDPRICASCHAQFMDTDMNDWGWIKMQDEYAAWLASPYSHQHEQDFASEAVVRCQDCHMPMLPAADPSNDVLGMVRSHHFPGANTVLPLLRGDRQQLLATETFLKANRLRVSIDTPNRSDALQSAQPIDESLRGFEQAPHYYYLGESANLNVIVSNQGVGHDFPGGTIDINQAWLEFSVVDAEGQSVFSSGGVGADHVVDPDAYFYRAVPIDRQGQEVWQHDLFNMVGESFRRVIKSGESDIAGYSFVVPSWAKSPITVSATLKYRKLNQRYARWALGEKYTELPIVDMAWDSLEIPIRIRREVEQAVSAND